MNFLIGDTYEQLVHPWTPPLQQYYNPQTRQKKPFYNLYVTVKYRCEGNKKSLELTPTNLLPQTSLATTTTTTTMQHSTEKQVVKRAFNLNSLYTKETNLQVIY